MINGTIFTRHQENLIFSREMANHVDIQNITTKSFIKKFLRKVLRFFGIRLAILNYNGKCLKKIKNPNPAMFFEADMDADLIRYAKKKNRKKRIIIWYWNLVEKTIHPQTIPEGVETWSYSQSDCERYGFLYNTQFYLKELVKIENETNFDLFFIGADKGRKAYLDQLETALQIRGLKTNFHITEAFNSFNTESKEYKKALKYNEIVALIAQSRAVLDYNCISNGELTLRPLEALFFSKKLITNNQNIKNYEFYNRDNIFIIGEDDISQIVSFIKTAYTPVEEDLVDYYDFENWIKRF